MRSSPQERQSLADVTQRAEEIIRLAADPEGLGGFAPAEDYHAAFTVAGFYRVPVVVAAALIHERCGRGELPAALDEDFQEIGSLALGELHAMLEPEHR